MATERGVGDSFDFLSVTGYLELQEKREKKGKLVSKKGKTRYWLWFDEKECVLKCYKNQESYREQYLLSPCISIAMIDAKVTPATIYPEHENDKQAFIITTKAGQIYFLTAESSEACHDWIKKLQNKRSQWIQKHSASIIETTSKLPFKVVDESSSSESSEIITTSRMRKIFKDHLKGADQLTPSDLFGNGCRPHSSTLPVPSSADQERSREDSSSSVEETDHVGVNSSPLRTFSSQQRSAIELRCELGDTKIERDKLLKQVVAYKEKLKINDKELSSLTNQVDELKETVHKLKSGMDFNTENENLKSVIEQLKGDLQSLVNEIKLYEQKALEQEKLLQLKDKRILELERHLLLFKSKYVNLMGNSFKIATPIPAGIPSEEPDPAEEKLKKELLHLIQWETTADNPLRDITSGLIFEDEFGELHDWNNDANICHYLSRQLYLHYTEHEQNKVCEEWENYLSGFKTINHGLLEVPTEGYKRKELAHFVRKGVPQSYRQKLWTSLVYGYVGKIKSGRDLTISAQDRQKGKTFYNTLYDKAISYQGEKQILLDLHRTLPSNKHFRVDGSGSEKLHRILTAYCNYNRNVGYCQGMNMIAAVGLLYLDEETAFWFLVTIIDILMPKYYYTSGLAAAQADQKIIRDLVEKKLPVLHSHIEANGIDVSVVTFNWFLTLFVDALPTEAMFRVIDCFLTEGRKVLFRFSLAILKLHEQRILSMNDPVTIFQFVKRVAQHIFDVDEMFKIAFRDFEPFPSRAQIQSQFQPLVDRFVEEWKERERHKETEKTVESVAKPLVLETIKQKHKQMQWECACITDEGNVYLACGERQTGRLCAVSASVNGFDCASPELNVGSKILCMRALSNGIIMIGTLDFSLHAFSVESQKELWSRKMLDSLLDIIENTGSIVCAFADGYISVLDSDGCSPPSNDPILYRIDNKAVQCIIKTSHNHIWCGSGKAIIVISAENYEPIQPILMPDGTGKVYHMELGDHGIWVTFKASTMISLFDSKYMVNLLYIDYTTLLPSPISLSSSSNHRITVVTPNRDTLWIGTGDATIHAFNIETLVTSPTDSIQQIAFKSQEVSTNQYRPKHRTGLHSALINVSDTSESSSTSTSINSEQHDTRKLKRTGFGRTFRHQVRSSKGASTDVQSIYNLQHMTTNKVLPKGQDCSRITVICPIRRDSVQFMISCVNTSSTMENSVQLWQCSSSISPDAWNYTCIPDCYEAVSKDIPSPTPPVLARERSTTIYGNLGSPN